MNLKVLGIFGLLIVLWTFLAFMVPESFLSGNNIENLLRRTALYGILGIGVTFVIITSGIDLSIGSLVGLTAVLLALFLSVTYNPFVAEDVLAVVASDKVIVVDGESAEFTTGQKVRYFGGRRAKSDIFVVEQVEIKPYSTDGDTTRQATYLHLDRSPTRDDNKGTAAPVSGVISFERRKAENTSRVEESFVMIDSGNDHIASRDKINFVGPTGAIKELPVQSIDHSTQGVIGLNLAGDIGGDFSNEWVAIPLERSQRMSVPMALAAVFAVAAALGIIHGLLVTKLKLQPFVVTLCGLLIYRGIARELAIDQVQGFGDEFSNSLSILSTGKLVLFTTDKGGVYAIPYPFFIILGFAIVAGIFLSRTIWGRYMLALGRNENAARYSGINTDRVTILAYVICTLAAALGGILFALHSNSVSPSSFGNFFELYAIAAAVLGGCSLRGGEGSIIGVVIGTAVMQTLYNLIVLLKISDRLEFAIIGAVILGGVMADEMVRRYLSARRAKASRAMA